MRFTYLAILTGTVMAAPAQAQTIVINHGATPVAFGDRLQRITINFQLSTPAPAMAATPDWTKAISNVSQSLFDIVNNECDVLTKTLKGDCRLVQLNTGGNINSRSAYGSSFGGENGSVSVNANATFEIGKAPIPAGTP